jgi:hypothetical protein
VKNYLAVVAVIILAAGSVGLAAPGALAATQSVSAWGTVAGTSGHAGVRAPLAPAPAASGPGWSIVPNPNPLARTGQLAGVSCASSSSCTAVGDYTKRLGTTVTLAERWTGTRWSAQSTPSPEGAPSSALNAVACPSSSACVAVGSAVTRSGTVITLAERWDGTKWSIQATPNPPAGGGILFGVSCSSASACTAVGASNAGIFAERWNGTKWLIQPAPNPPSGGGVLFGVACTSAVSCTAVGGSNSGTLAEHWNGTTWGIQATPNPSGAQFSFLNAVSCTSASACTAVGGYGTSSGTPVTVAERWDGTRWSIQPTPNRTQASASGLFAVSCPVPSFCMAAGPSFNGFSTPVSLAESWNGKTWEIQNTPNLPGAEPSFLIGVSCPSPANCMAVGGTGTDNAPRKALVAEHWNGNGWAIVPVPDPPGMTSAGGNLESVSCPGPSACMAVGAYANSSSQGQAFPVGQPLSERWNGTKWSVVPVPHLPGAQATFLNSISCTSGFACTAVAGVVSASGRLVTMAERWNGTRWRIQPTPNPAGTRGAELSGVACTAPSACTVVGGSFANASLAERWNGTKWAIQASPNPPGQIGDLILFTVACPRPLECMAVGKYASFAPQFTATLAPQLKLAEQWNGSNENTQPAANVAENPAALGMACLRVQRLSMKGFTAAASSAARLGARRGPSTTPPWAWIAFLPPCRGT